MNNQEKQIILPIEILRPISAKTNNNFFQKQVKEWYGQNLDSFLSVIDAIEHLSPVVAINNIDIATQSFCLKNQNGEDLRIKLLPKIYFPDEKKIIELTKKINMHNYKVDYYECSYDNIEVNIRSYDITKIQSQKNTKLQNHNQLIKKRAKKN